jgi:hypothetical protein
LAFPRLVAAVPHADVTERPVQLLGLGGQAVELSQDAIAFVKSTHACAMLYNVKGKG